MKKSKKIPYTPKYKFGGFEKTIFTPDKDDKQKMKKFGKQAGTAAYGVGEGLLDTVTMGATDQITDQGYYALQKAGNSTKDEMREQDSIRGFSNAAGAIGGAIINPGATGTAISQTGKGLGAGISKGNESKEWAAGAGMALNTAGQIGGMAYGQAGSPMTSGMQTQAGNFNASSFGQGLDKYNQYNQYMNQGSGNGQMGGILNSLMGGGSGGMGAGFMSNLPSGTPPLAMKYGGQMKFAMGGMNKYPGGGMGKGNSQVELDENSVAPNGQFTQFNEPSHDVQNSNQPNASLAPGEKIFSAKLKPMGSKKSFADLNKSNNTNREDKLFSKGNLDPKSEVSLKLTMMAKMKNSDVLFAMQEQLKKDKVAAYAKKMGVEMPPMDNEQMEPQGEMPMAKYGGIHINPANKGKFTASAQRAGMGTQEFANHVLANKEDYSSTQVKRANFAHNAAGWKHAMGGVQLPYYNTDNAGNPIYAMGGGYPAMTNPYHNFRGSIPMYPDGGNMPEDPLTTTPTTNGTTPGTRPLAISEVPALKKTGYEESNAKVKDRKIEMYNNPDYLIQHQNIDGTKWNDFQKFMSTYKLPNGQNFVGNESANTNLSNNYTDLVMSDYNKTLSQKYKDNPDEATRRSISLGDLEEVQKYYNQGDPNLKVDRILGGEATQLKLPHWSSVSKRELKPGEYMPITYGGKQYVVDADTYNTKFKGAWEGTSNENLTKYFQPYDYKKHMNINDDNVKIVNRLGTVPGGSGPFVKKELGKLPPFIYRVGQGTQEEQLKNYQKENGLAFKYGGQMPKYEGGGTFVNGVWVPYQSSYKPGTMGYNDSMNSPQNPSNDSLQSSYGPSVLPWNRTNDSNQGPNGAAQKYTMENPTQQFQEATTSGSPNITQTDPNSKNFDWGNLAMQGLNFAGQNMGNIYDLSRKDAPLQSYERATGKFLDPTQARRDEQYAYRQANKAIPGLVGGSAGAAMNLLGANRAKTSTNIGRINKEYENANAQIGNQLNQYNTEIAYREAEARAKDAAMKENIRSQAIHGIGTSVGKATKSGKEDVMDQKTLEMYKQYYNNPQFRAALKKAGYDV